MLLVIGAGRTRVCYKETEMRVILAEEITRNIKEMCIEANYEL